MGLLKTDRGKVLFNNRVMQEIIQNGINYLLMFLKKWF